MELKKRKQAEKTEAAGISSITEADETNGDEDCIVNLTRQLFGQEIAARTANVIAVTTKKVVHC